MTRSVWAISKQTDPRAVALYLRHYSKRKGDGRHGIAGPGQTMTLLLGELYRGDALYLWRTERWLGKIPHPYVGTPQSLGCSIFRNESGHLSSLLILEAEDLAAERWPDRWLFTTWVEPASIRSTNPGFCFQKAGWAVTEYRDRMGKVLLVKNRRAPDALRLAHIG